MPAHQVTSGNAQRRERLQTALTAVGGSKRIKGQRSASHTGCLDRLVESL
jgi:hypothetical protein